MLQNTEGVIKEDNPEKLEALSAQDTGQINLTEYRRGNKKRTIQRNWQHWVHKKKTNEKKTQHNMCWTLLCADTHYVSKICALLQTTGGKDELRIVFFCRNRNGHDNNVATCK